MRKYIFAYYVIAKPTNKLFSPNMLVPNLCSELGQRVQLQRCSNPEWPILNGTHFVTQKYQLNISISPPESY